MDPTIPVTISWDKLMWLEHVSSSKEVKEIRRREDGATIDFALRQLIKSPATKGGSMGATKAAADSQDFTVTSEHAFASKLKSGGKFSIGGGTEFEPPSVNYESDHESVQVPVHFIREIINDTVTETKHREEHQKIEMRKKKPIPLKKVVKIELDALD